VNRGLKEEESGFDSKKNKGRDRKFLFTDTYIQVLWLSKILIQWVPNAFFPGNKAGSVQN
jgi:hypothetical protein